MNTRVKCNKCSRLYEKGLVGGKCPKCRGTLLPAPSRVEIVSPEIPDLPDPPKTKETVIEESQEAPSKKERIVDGVRNHKRMIVLVILVVCAILIVGSLMVKNKVPSAAPMVVAKTAVPSVKMPSVVVEPPIDMKSVSVITGVQCMLIGLSIIMMVAGYLDRKRSNQAYDAIVAYVCGVFILFVAPWPPIQAGIAQLGIGAFPWAWIAVLIPTAIVLAVSLTGGVDLTPTGLFLGLLGIVGGVILGNLEEVQLMFGIGEGTLYPIETLSGLLMTKQFEVAKFSLLVYGLLAAGCVLLIIEVMKKQHDGTRSWAGILIALVGILTYVGLRAIPWTGVFMVLQTPFVALLFVFAINLLVASIAREKIDSVTRDVNWAEYKLGLVRVSSPWDVVSLQAMVGSLLIIAFGNI